MIIRQINQNDVESFPKAFAAQGWDKPRARFEAYLAAQRDGAYTVLVAEVDAAPAGYVLLKPCAMAGPYAGQGIPEIADLNVLAAYQHRGVGSALLDEAERLAGGPVTLGVGLHAGYGAAQRLYVKRGYVPDGSGVWYRDRPATPYAAVENDDDLVLYMVKGVRG